ncbi:efflux RND transporter periplasmic adaptor subunit [Clostridioides difficile]
MRAVKKYKALSKKTIAIVLATTLVIGTTSYVYINSTKNNKEDSQLVSREREYIVKRGDITAGTTGSGVLKFEQTTQNFGEPVQIDEVFVKEGQEVKKGDKIASVSEKFINDKLKELNSQLEQAKSSLNSANNSKQAAILTQNKSWQDTVQSSKDQYESQRSSIVNNINSLNEKINGLNTKINEIKKQIEELSQNAAGNDEQIQGLKVEQGSVEMEKSSVESELNAANSSLKSLDSDRNKQVQQESQSKASDDKINLLSNSGLNDAITNAQKEVDKINEEISKVNKLKENSILYAEADGIILALNYASGATTMPEQPVVAIGKGDKVTAEVTISQNDITKIEAGQEVKLSVTAFADEKFTGKVTSLNLKPNTQGNSTNYSVTVEVDKSDYKLLDGMTASAQFIVKEVKDIIMLSNKAITLKDGKEIVNIKQEDGIRKEVEITTGFSDGKNTEIISGLSEGDIVVVGGQ